jgi:hypothetical protein
VLNAILYVMRSGCRWCDLPHDLGDDSTAHRWFLRWMEDGVWEKIWFALLSSLDDRRKLDWAIALLDGSFVPAKKGAARWLRAQRQRRDDPPDRGRQRFAAIHGGDGRHCSRNEARAHDAGQDPRAPFAGSSPTTSRTLDRGSRL